MGMTPNTNATTLPVTKAGAPVTDMDTLLSTTSNNHKYPPSFSLCLLKVDEYKMSLV